LPVSAPTAKALSVTEHKGKKLGIIDFIGQNFKFQNIGLGSKEYFKLYLEVFH